MVRAHARRLLTLLLLSLAGCDGKDSPTDPMTSVATTVTLATTTLSFSSFEDTQQLIATVRGQNGAIITEASVTWTSSASSVASVSSTGLVAAVANGTATITATSGSATGTASVAVGQIAASVTLSPSALVLPGPGATATVTASVMDAGDSEIANPDLTWSSSDESIATVHSSGLVTAVASGSATITVTTGAQVQALSITVEESSPVDPVGGEVSLADGAVKLVFPANAVSEAIFITAQPATGLPAEPGLISGTAFDFGPDGIVFDQPVTLTIEYDPSDLPPGVPEERLGIYTLHGDHPFWDPVDGVVDVSNHTVSAAIDGFSTFSVIARAEQPKELQKLFEYGSGPLKSFAHVGVWMFHTAKLHTDNVADWLWRCCKFHEHLEGVTLGVIIHEPINVLWIDYASKNQADAQKRVEEYLDDAGFDPELARDEEGNRQHGDGFSSSVNDHFIPQTVTRDEGVAWVDALFPDPNNHGRVFPSADVGTVGTTEDPIYYTLGAFSTEGVGGTPPQVIHPHMFQSFNEAQQRLLGFTAAGAIPAELHGWTYVKLDTTWGNILRLTTADHKGVAILVRGGNLSVEVSTTGEDLDPAFTVVVDADTAKDTIGSNATLDLGGFPAGTYSVELIDVEGNCTVPIAQEVELANSASVLVTFEVVCTGILDITTTSLPSGTVDESYSETLAGTGGDGNYTWALFNATTLPDGLSLDGATGEISGTPTAAGTHNFEVEVTSADKMDSQALSITINEPEATGIVLEPHELCSEHPPTSIATFEDANLEEAVRNELGIGANEDLTCELISGLGVLPVRLRGITSITSLVGIQNLTNLDFLDLAFNSITDLSPLGGLINLTDLRLDATSISDISALSGLPKLRQLLLGINSITEINPLKGLTSLKSLSLHDNPIGDISALNELTNLEFLDLVNTSISDISALSELTNLVFGLRLDDNSITDIGALRGLTKLTELQLRFNPDLTDIQPLLDNTGLGAGDRVLLDGTNVICSEVVALGAKGVEVNPEGCDQSPSLGELPNETGVVSLRGHISNVGARADAFAWEFRVDGVVEASGRVGTLSDQLSLTETAGPFSAGTHTLELRVDVGNEVAELREDNNTVSSTFTVP